MRKTSLNTIYSLAKKDERVVFIGSDLGPGVLSEFKKNIPDRFFMEGIAEQNIIGISAGLALDGLIPYVNTIGTFLTRRCYEQIVVDLCLHNLPVRLIANGGGLVYAPLGPTHQAIEDIAILRAIPNITIICPCDAIEMKKLIEKTLNWPGPIYVRLAKGGDKIITNENASLEIGKSSLFKELNETIFISTGVMTQICLEASDELEKNGIKSAILHMSTVKPLDIEKLKIILPKVKNIITVEEHIRSGGLGTSILEFINDNNISSIENIIRFGIPDKFSDKYGNQESILNYYDLTSENLVKSVTSLYK